MCELRGLEPRRSRPELGTGKRPPKGYFPVLGLTFALSCSVMAASLFGYLKYRAYLSTVRHLVDRHGLRGIQVIKVLHGDRGLASGIERDRADADVGDNSVQPEHLDG